MTDMPAEPWPQTLEEAVESIMAELSQEDKITVRNTPREDLIRFHHGWGTGIRNSFGLWQGNQALLQACNSTFPDDASMVIIEAVWEQLQSS
ncbi:hypothetical protein BST81_02280 [Leptolyngbya sp. 'hensonii']|uniref:DUF6794 domain-containing protein n=1 Tax=Leptolyngbya sp. 'hensonii' TaxID=1922337 RepID=UPI00094FE31F|nr:DUF6794 domain-containing protein [Leptolyngbya sp. 'hensonii']OLP20086.1 hypothetical protein BST81_02280 [Leptolyngbya sp. 'hensonii']